MKFLKEARPVSSRRPCQLLCPGEGRGADVESALAGQGGLWYLPSWRVPLSPPQGAGEGGAFLAVLGHGSGFSARPLSPLLGFEPIGSLAVIKGQFPLGACRSGSRSEWPG